MRETIKEITLEVDGEEMTFRIKKMDALRGSGLLKFAIETLLPAMNKVQNIFEDDNNEEVQAETEEEKERIIKEKTEERVQKLMATIPEVLSQISEDDLINLEKKCLKTVECRMPAGWITVLVGENFSVPALAYDTIAVLMLTYRVIEFNLSGFFEGRSLASLPSLQNTLSQKA